MVLMFVLMATNHSQTFSLCLIQIMCWSVSTIPPLANYDHYGIFWLSCPIRAKKVRPRREVWKYAHVELDRACTILRSMDLDLMFASDDVNDCWRRWKQSFLGIFEECIPRATLPDSINPPWLSKRILQMIKKQNYFYRLANTTGNLP